MSWKIVYTKQAQKDAKKLAAAGLKPKAEKLLEKKEAVGDTVDGYPKLQKRFRETSTVDVKEREK